VKFFMKQQPFSWRDKFFIRDEAEKDILSVEGEIFTWGAKLHIFDQKGQEIAFIRQQVLSWRPRFYIEINGREIGCVIQRFALIGTRFDVDGLGWAAEGTFGSHDFTLFDKERIVMSVRKAWFTWGDSYELDIPKKEEVLPAICILLAIDMAIEAANNRGAV
jgi:uncharacterized protein YxjI